MIVNRLVRAAAIGLSLVALIGTTELASASVWTKHHPRRAEVNHRLVVQNRRIHRDVREGEMTHRKAVRLHRKDQRIRKEERLMARNRKGAITKPEKRVLNKQENKVNKEIGK